MTLSRLPAILLLAALLAACRPAAPTPAPPTAFPFPPTHSPLASSTVEMVPSPSPTETPPPARRVLILSLDGLRPEAITLAPMPELQALMQSGASSLLAQTIYPPGTLPAHASMLTGLCPEKHGVDWNDYDPARGHASGTSLFDLAHAAGLTTVMVAGKDKLSQISAPASLDRFEYLNDRGLVIAQYAADEVIPQGFDLLFVHFPTPDWMGHTYGWLSWEYLSVVRQDDRALGILLAALDQAGLRAGTLVIVTADHGGHDQTHSTRRPEDMTIPWIIAGPGVLPRALTGPVSTTDTAATAAWALGLDLPPEWDGIPVYEAFGLPDQERPEPRCP